MDSIHIHDQVFHQPFYSFYEIGGNIKDAIHNQISPNIIRDIKVKVYIQANNATRIEIGYKIYRSIRRIS